MADLAGTWVGVWAEPWALRAVAAAALTGVPAALLGVFLYLRRESLLVDGMAHAALPGIVAAWLLFGDTGATTMLAGALAAAALVAGLVRLARRIPRVREDAALGIVFPVLFSLGVIALTRWVRTLHLDPQCVLWGDVLGVPDDAFPRLVAAGIAVVLLVIVAERRWTIAAFDPVWAVASGAPLAGALLPGATALVAVQGMEVTGAILIVAFFLIPAATVHPWAGSVRGMLGGSAALVVLAAVVGVALSGWADTTTGATIVLTLFAAFLLSRFAQAIALRREPVASGLSSPAPTR